MGLYEVQAEGCGSVWGMLKVVRPSEMQTEGVGYLCVSKHICRNTYHISRWKSET